MSDCCSNAIPVAIAVPATPGPALGPGTSVQNLGAVARTLVFRGASTTDSAQLWGSLDGVTFGKVEREIASGETRPIVLSGLADNVTLDDDRSLFYATSRVAGSGAASLLVTGADVGSQLSAASGAFHARNVGPAANVANLAAFTVAGNDGVTDAQGDVVYLYAQTDPAQNGPYVVGPVAAGVAPLTRPSWWAAATVVQAGQVVEVASGTVFGGTDWRAYALAPFVVDVGDPVAKPVHVGLLAILAAGTVTVTSIPIRSATGQTSIQVTRFGAGGDVTLTLEYNVRAVTAGPLGTASVTIESALANATGTINVLDTSTLLLSIHN